MDDNYLRGSGSPARFTLKNLLKNRSVVIMLLVGVPIFSFITFSPRGIVARLSLEAEKGELREAIRLEEERRTQLEKLARDLDHDLRAIETVARVKYGMVREGETVYKVKKGS